VRRIAAVILFSAALLAAPAAAEAKSMLAAAAELGAAANVCDPVTHQLGVQATMPGGSIGERMYTRFSAEWLRPSTQRWEAIGGSASPWIAAGPGPWLYRTSGYTRTFGAAPGGTSFVLRGVVEMEWRGAGGTRREIAVSGPCILG
jgi:hypothetical protein